jgi:hypothetical protein
LRASTTDPLEPNPHWPEKLERLRPKRQKFRIDRRHNIAATEIVLDRLDGAYQCRYSIRAETPAPIAAPPQKGAPLSQTANKKHAWQKRGEG